MRPRFESCPACGHVLSARIPALEADPIVDAEARVVRELARRSARMKLGIAIPITVLGMAVGLYLAGLAYYSAASLMPKMQLLLGFFVAVGAATGLAVVLIRTGLRRLAPRWARQLARQHGLDPESLDDFVRFL